MTLEERVDDVSEIVTEKPRVSRPRVMDEVTEAIASDIFSGRYKPGHSLPTENELCTAHGVSRTVIREALKVLAAKGLILTRPRIGSVVCEEDNWNIIDAQVLAWHASNALGDKLFDAILEARRAIEPLVAEIAASRATMREIADLEAACDGMANAGEDIVVFSRHDIAFHQTLYAASHNPVFRQIGGMIDAALTATLRATAVISVDHRTNAVVVHRELLEALRMRNQPAAREAANRILDLAAHDLEIAKKNADS
ncbi:MAG: FadR family transcriptional regulator [Rhizobiaceae bacterium]|nr:FadR family transcriptional regulator [Rhizobiaceae bacterium]